MLILSASKTELFFMSLAFITQHNFIVSSRFVQALLTESREYDLLSTCTVLSLLAS